MRIHLKIDGANIEKIRLEKLPEQKANSYEYTVELDLRSANEETAIISEELIAEFPDQNHGILRYSMSRTRNQITIDDPVFNQAPRTAITIQPQDATRLAAGAGFFSLPPVVFRNYIEGWSFYDIKPEVARRPCKETSEQNLGEYGENLAAILHNLEKQNSNHGSLAQIVSSLRGVVPGFNSIKTNFFDVEGQWSFKVIEDRISEGINPRSVSDGTIRLLALAIIANWSVRHSTLLVIEEPETGLHPHLSGYVIELLRSAANKRQIIATTHNPDFLDELEPKEVILCDKQDGFTSVRHASDIADIDTFRKHFRLGELWEQGVLGGTL